MRIVGHGIDLVSVSRIEAMIGDHADRFLQRCFTAGEREYNAGSRRYAEHIAARFAAKEAAMKALGTGLASGISWTEIEVVSEATGRPGLRVTGVAAQIAESLKIDEWWISLTHTDDHACASVIAVSNRS